MFSDNGFLDVVEYILFDKHTYTHSWEAINIRVFIFVNILFLVI